MTASGRVGLVVALACGIAGLTNDTRAGQSPKESDSAFAMSLDVGRLDTMVSKAEEAADVLLPGDMPGATANPREQDNATFQNLKMVVLRYNLLVAAACGMDPSNAGFCREPYLPDWLRDPPTAKHSRGQLQGMIKEATSKITPFWISACVRGKIITGDDHFCDLE
jgi:hypothetical protein